MTVLSSAWQQLQIVFANLFSYPNWRNLLDIFVVTLVIYQIIKMLNRTRANSVLKGVGFVLALTWLSEILQLNTMNWLLLQMLNTGAVLLVVLFQPELRRGLEQIGRSSWRKIMPSATKEQLSVEKIVNEFVTAMTDLSRRRVGALIVFEMSTGLDDIVKTGTVLDADISAPLIENIFEPNTPLHDGAVIVRGNRIVAAACILGLSDDQSISRELGTRHRAALGISETTDAIALIVSEETGTMSMARGGKLTRYLDAKSLVVILTELYSRPVDSLWQFLLKRKEDSDAK